MKTTTYWLLIQYNVNSCTNGLITAMQVCTMQIHGAFLFLKAFGNNMASTESVASNDINNGVDPSKGQGGQIKGSVYDTN